MNDAELINEFQQIEDDFNAAIISNKVSEIKKCITPDWVLVDAHLTSALFFNLTRCAI